MRLRRLVPLLLALAVVASSCDGDGTVFDTTTTAATPGADLVDAEISGVAEAIVADLGPEPGILAVGYALDRGYTASQIADGGLSGGLQADGTINGVQPALPLWEIFADLPPANGSGAGGSTRTISRVLGFADEPNPYGTQITAEQYVHFLGLEFEAVMSGRPTPSAPSSGGSSTTTTEPEAPDDQERATIMIGLIVELSDLGYSAEQIILGIVLGEVRMTLIPTGLGPAGCWLLEDAADGRVIRPALPPAVTTRFPATAECREAIDRLAPPDTDSTTTTTTTVNAVDADGIQDGTYTGIVQVTGEVASGAVYEILGGEIRLEVTDQGVRAEVAYTVRVSVRPGLEGPVCIATIDYLYTGEQPALPTLGFPLRPASQSIRLLEGPECGIGGRWATTAEDDLLAGFAEERTITLAGSFRNGRFDGYVSGTPLGVTAAIGG